MCGDLIMTRLLIMTLLVMPLLISSLANADEFKYRKLKPADPPCLFLLDEDTGQPTGNAVNPPCVLGSTVVNPGDTVDPILRKKYGQTQAAGNTGPAPRRTGR
jgi:hypothetical protein